MNSIRIGFIGNGWRAETFWRIMDELPEVFEYAGVLFRNAEKAAAFNQRHPGKGFTKKEELLAAKPDYVVVAIDRYAAGKALSWLMDEQIPILCETPPATSVEALCDLWEEVQQKGGRIQVAEQYFLQPYHASILKLVEEGTIGRVETAALSMMHDYHSISMMRKLLDAGFCGCSIDGRSFNVPVYRTCGRSGLTEPELVDDLLKSAVFRFENETVGFHHFSGEQYFNYLRSRHLQVAGDAGEIFDLSVRGLNENDQPYEEFLRRVDAGPYSNLEGMFHHGMLFGQDMIYRNPFAKYTHARLTDDEIAIAGIMVGMKEYVDTGKDIYSLADGMQDTYLYYLMDESIHNNCTVYTKPMPWQKED